METTTMMNPDKTAWLDMTDAEKGSLLLAEHRGKVIEYWWPITDKWTPCKLGPYWLPQVFYRAQPKPLTKPSIDWSHVADKIVAIAEDSDGLGGCFYGVPNKVYGDWLGHRACNASVFASYRPGTCDWTDSLVQRPTSPNT
jgi:hypothetical protein